MAGRKWTKEEEMYLEEKWGTVSLGTICKKLNRTETAVKNRVFQKQLGPFLLNGSYITIAQLWFAMGHRQKMSSQSKRFLIEKRKLPHKKQKIGNSFAYVVEIDEFWKWAKENKKYIDFSRMEENILGEEPDWVKEQRKKDHNSPKGCKKWSEQDIEKLKFYMKRNYSYPEIASLLNRTILATKRKANCLGLKKEKDVYKIGEWTKEEEECLISCIRQGDTYETIIKDLNRSMASIRRRLLKQYGTSVLEQIEKIIESEKTI